MNLLEFEVTECPEYQKVTFSFKGALEPTELETATLPKLDKHRPVVLSGTGTGWLYSWLAQQCSDHPWVALHDVSAHRWVVVRVRPGTGHAYRLGSTIPIFVENDILKPDASN